MPNRAGSLTAEQFVAKWSKAQLSERAASQEHFIDLCHLLDQPTPAEADATGEDYCFEKHVKVVGSASKGSKGDYGFVDVWKRGRLFWEHETKDKQDIRVECSATSGRLWSVGYVWRNKTCGAKAIIDLCAIH